MAKPKNKEEIAAVVRHLPLQPPKEIIETIKGRQKTVKLIYRCGYYREPLTGLKQKAAQVHCTACGRNFFLDYTQAHPCHCNAGYDTFGFIDPLDHEAKQTSSACICPECGAEATALHISHIPASGCNLDKTYFMTLHNVRGHFVALGWALYKDVDKDGHIYYNAARYEGVMIIEGRPVRLVGYRKCIYTWSWLPTWEARARWRDNCDEWDADEIFTVDEDAFEATEVSKSALDVYIKDTEKQIRVAAYLHLWTRYPQIENLTRSDLSVFVRNLIKAGTTTSYYGYNSYYGFSIPEAEKHFNTKAVKPFEIVGLDKTEIDLAKFLDLEMLEYYKKTLKDHGIRLTVDQLSDIKRFGFSSFDEVLDVAAAYGRKAPIIHTLNYLIKQRIECGGRVSCTELLDYWNMINEINNGLPVEIMFPKRLEDAHDEAMLRIEEKVNEEINRGIAALARAMEDYTFTDEELGLFIRPAASQTELIKEGKILHHCVGSYAKDVSLFKTCILFIRRIENPDKPFFTLEYKNGHVEQNRGLRNCARTPEVEAFEAKWLKHIEEVKHGKRNADDSVERAVA